MKDFLILFFVCLLIGWVFSLTLHEFSHALVAYLGGDYTVREKGYLSFNPLKYMHPMLSIGLPLLFVCEDNQWSATTRTSTMSAGDGAAARAIGYGVPAVAVDGMDVAAVWQTAGELIRQIRAGEGPRLLHAKTYRFKGHVSVDPAAYRDPAELEAALAGDPIARARMPLVAAGIGDEQIEAVMREAREEVAAAVASAAAAPWPEPGAAFDDIQDTGSGRWLN